MKMKIQSPKPKVKEVFISSLVNPKDASLVEMVYSEDQNSTRFIQYFNGEIDTRDYIEKEDGRVKLLPFPPNNDLVKNKVILFPSYPAEYGNDRQLLNNISNFIHKYLDVSPFFEKISSYYVLFTWVYDCFNELPYLRALGDYGTGKSRLLKVVGSICYKPMFTAGATTVSPVFRIIDSFRGTLILDEADLKFSDTTMEIIKILNSGYASGTPVLRSVTDGKNGFDVKSFNVYCPKIIGTRGRFQDKALESRFLVEVMDKNKLRDDIPINLPESFEKGALDLRNQLLMWRFKNHGSKKIKHELVDKSIEPRLNQIIVPLASVIEHSELIKELQDFIREYNRQLTSDRGMTWEAGILEAIIELKKELILSPTVKEITERHNATVEEKEKITNRKTGYIIREKLGFITVKTRDGYIVEGNEKNNTRFFHLVTKYGLDELLEGEKREHVNDVNVATGVDKDDLPKFS
ncbi:MAG: hypothetical protein PHW95_02575 [Patescibacteria group bacterium]|nr:hypothetical protein [Patescibacteria group bacterium]